MAPSDPELLTLTNEDERFYPLLGPLLARRTVHKALGGYAPFDDDGKTWIVARDPAGRTLGFVGLTPRATTKDLHVESLYVAPGERAALYTLLLRAAVRAADGRALHATAARARRDHFLAAGFTHIPFTEKFDKFTREATP
ncbi:hypothetical protein [Kitasatospora sp. NPDC088548]|uniref:hypothetical protein n=1 Tax=Kitasatospora sp. NPDC088548 TaxID=3364075 RepID=UPI00382605BE